MTNQDELRPTDGDNQSQPLSIEAQLEAARAEADAQRQKAEAYLDLAQRAQADLINFKRRKEQELEQKVRDANADLLRQILPVLDDLDRALAHIPSELSEQSWIEGVKLISQKLDRVLSQQGLARIGTEGDLFDPHVHEAVAYEEHPSYEEGQVAGVYRVGYRLNDRVLRPAQVVVARAASGQPSAASRPGSPES